MGGHSFQMAIVQARFVGVLILTLADLTKWNVTTDVFQMVAEIILVLTLMKLKIHL